MSLEFKLTGKYKSVLLGIISPLAFIDFSAASRLPPSLTCEISPFCQVFNNVSMSLASQFVTNRPSHASRNQDSKSGYLLNGIYYYNSRFARYSYSQTIGSIVLLAEPLLLRLTFTFNSLMPTYRLAIRPSAIYSCKRTNSVFRGRSVVSTVEILRCHKCGLRALQKTGNQVE